MDLRLLWQYSEAALSILLKEVCFSKLNFPFIFGRLSMNSTQALYLSLRDSSPASPSLQPSQNSSLLPIEFIFITISIIAVAMA